MCRIIIKSLPKKNWRQTIYLRTIELVLGSNSSHCKTTYMHIWICARTSFEKNWIKKDEKKGSLHTMLNGAPNAHCIVRYTLPYHKQKHLSQYVNLHSLCRQHSSATALWWRYFNSYFTHTHTHVVMWLIDGPSLLKCTRYFKSLPCNIINKWIRCEIGNMIRFHDRWKAHLIKPNQTKPRRTNTYNGISH